MENKPLSNRKGLQTTSIMVVLLFLGLLYLTITATGKFNSNYENQPYTQFVCKQMAERSGTFSINEKWFLGLITAKSDPLEKGLGAADCGLVLPQVTGTKENIIKLITNYSKQACEFGNNNTIKELTWVKSLPVKAMDGDIDYAAIAPAGPPGMKPCYLVWRINTGYVTRDALPTATSCTTEEEVLCTTTSSAESTLKKGDIKRNVVTALRIDYFKMAVNGDLITLCAGTGCDTAGFVEIWGVTTGE